MAIEKLVKKFHALYPLDDALVVGVNVSCSCGTAYLTKAKFETTHKNGIMGMEKGAYKRSTECPSCKNQYDLEYLFQDGQCRDIAKHEVREIKKC